MRIIKAITISILTILLLPSCSNEIENNAELMIDRNSDLSSNLADRNLQVFADLEGELTQITDAEIQSFWEHVFEIEPSEYHMIEILELIDSLDNESNYVLMGHALDGELHHSIFTELRLQNDAFVLGELSCKCTSSDCPSSCVAQKTQDDCWCTLCSAKCEKTSVITHSHSKSLFGI